ncbi:hypothetical protein [Gemmata sp.]|uniref:hypothetical protein n=1 Tax=Gemmata sp. TaxID=1914242 RepID=UPI003F6E6732
MRAFVVRVAEVRSFEDFITAFNEGFCRHVGGHWTGNLNAFNDNLSWPAEERYRLILQGWQECASALVRVPYQPRESLRDVLMEILQANDHVELVTVHPETG